MYSLYITLSETRINEYLHFCKNIFNIILLYYKIIINLEIEYKL